jgi:tRNA(Ile)-lysidine synthase TilS/MesJ
MNQGKNPLFDRPASTLEERFINSIHKRISQTLFNHELLEPHDKVLIALSGGKDSLALIEILAERKKSLPFVIELEAAHIVIPSVGYQTDIDYMRNFCEANQVPLSILQPAFDLQKNTKKSMCFRCSWTRRTALFKIADNKGFTKIAFGHHLDDALETLLINMTCHGSISSMPYMFQMHKGNFAIIRPLLDVTDSDLIRYCAIRNFSADKTSCPFGEHTTRNEMKQVISTLEKINKKAKINMFRSMGNVCKEYLPAM